MRKLAKVLVLGLAFGLSFSVFAVEQADATKSTTEPSATVQKDTQEKAVKTEKHAKHVKEAVKTRNTYASARHGSGKHA